MSCQVNFPLQDIVMLLREKINPEIIGAVSEEKLEEEVLLLIQPKIDELQEQLTKLPPEVHVVAQVLEGTTLETTLNNGSVLSVDFSTLFGEFDGLVDLYDKNVALGVGDSGWSTELVVENGKSQKQINADVAVKILRAKDIGLTAWSTMKKPPYTTQEYKQAYDNGINLSNAVKAAYDAGYNSVVLERGYYPFCYNSPEVSSEKVDVGIGGCCTMFKNIANMSIDFNNSTLFAIFDSDNRSPYDKTTNATYAMSGRILNTRDVEFIEFKNADVRGDMYMRSWNNAAEKNTEQTYGLQTHLNSRFVSIKNMKFNGFRGDGVSGVSRGYNVSWNPTWSSGGIDSAGNDIVETGSYRTALIDLTLVGIKNNSIQIMTSGYTREPEFRNPRVKVVFYDSTGGFLSSEYTYTTLDIALPKNATKVRFVAYDDERVDATVSYGTVVIATGSSQFFYAEHCEFYANNRGGLSNQASNTLLKHCKFYDLGDAITKYGFQPYSSSTKYAINFEDVYTNGFSIDNCSFNNAARAFIGLTRQLKITNCDENNSTFQSVVYSVQYAYVAGNKFDSASLAVSYSATVMERTSMIANNRFSDTTCIYTLPSGNLHTLMHSNNVYNNCKVMLVGQNNIVSNGNIYKNLKGQYDDALVATGLKAFDDHVLSIDTKKAGWRYLYASCVNPKNMRGSIDLGSNAVNTVSLKNTDLINGLNFGGISIISPLRKTMSASALNKLSAYPSGIDKIVFDGSYLKYINFEIGSLVALTEQLVPTTLNATNAHFDQTNFKVSKNSEPVGSVTTIEFTDCRFSVDTLSYVVNIAYALTTTCVIKFTRCVFDSATAKSLPLVSGNLANVTSQLIDCEFVNVTNTDTITTVYGKAKVTYDPPSLATATQQSTTVTLNGAKLGDNISVAFDKPLQGTRMWAEVSAADTVTVYHRNDTGAAVDLASGTLAVKIV